ncbi:hypothetical protein [Pedobacter rhodius]|uniref:Lipocalin-like domain-containing protein n=1 Tax=Pedobacter rhodius TaxID=3004098 RepID=A0ABT4KWF6_9SPHI|nr:hypothetical protein [Pedobacter sp. SJ11]MCZ4223269.1 hypothetical protein [Pedobacter sp. SJ11]
MKHKFYTLFLIFSVFLISCKKDTENTPTTDNPATLKQKVLGNWVLTRASFEYYDASGKLVKSEDQPSTNEQTLEFFNNNSVNTYDSRGTRSYTYSFSSSNNINYINIENNPTETYKVAIDNNKMTWVLEGPSNDPAYATAKATIYFSKK